MKHLFSVILSGILVTISVCSCSSRKVSGDVIDRHAGQIKVILLGMPGCPGTEQSTPLLEQYADEKPKDVFIGRVDVPIEGGSLQRADGLSANLYYDTDEKRVLAGRLEFFFYPTLYVIDKEGAVRFAGECDIDKIKKMVAEISAEPAGSPKKMYTPPLIEVGSAASDFSLPDVDGKQVSLKSVCSGNGAILFFSTTTCPFSVKALDDLERVKAEFKTNKFSYVIVSFGQGAAEVKAKYAEKSPGSVVLIDADKKLSTETFGVSAVPYFYVLDSNLKVIDRKPFIYDTARTAVAKALGITSCATNAASCGTVAG